MEEDSKLTVFISHSNKDKDYFLVNNCIIPKLMANNITIYGQEKLLPGTDTVSSITKVVHDVDKMLLFMSKNSLESSWCSFELLISLEKSQRSNKMSVVLLLDQDLLESELPHIAVLQEAPKIYFTEWKDDWVTETVEALKGGVILSGEFYTDEPDIFYGMSGPIEMNNKWIFNSPRDGFAFDP